MTPDAGSVADAFLSVSLDYPLGAMRPGEAAIAASERRCPAEFGFGYLAAVWVVAGRGRSLASVDPRLEESVRRALAGYTPDAWADEPAASAVTEAAAAAVRHLYPHRESRPHRSRLLYCDRGSWQDCGLGRCEPLTDSDDPVVRALPEAGLPRGWCTFGEGTVFGVVEEGRLLATACTMPIEHMASEVGDVGAVYTVPEHRRQGLASACVSAVARAVLDSGRLPVYRVAQSNVASQCTARRAGFRHHADQFVLAVSTDEGPP